MKPIITLMLLSAFTISFSQGIDESIKEYKNGNYEQCILMLNQVILNSESDDSKAEGYFYRAMARKKLEKRDPGSFALGKNPLNAAIVDFNRAKKFDSSLAESVDEELMELYPVLLKKAKKSAREITSANTDQERVDQIERTISYYGAAYQIDRDFSINEQLGLLYQQLGDYYMEQQPSNRAFKHYEKALKHLEEANEEYAMSKQVTLAIEAVSSRLNEVSSPN